MNGKSPVVIFMGEGAGKSSAAIGRIIKALGSGMAVHMIQLFKDETSEREFLKPFLQYSQFTHSHPIFISNPEKVMDIYRLQINEYLDSEIKKIYDEEPGLVVIDELGAASRLVDESKIIDLIRNRPSKTGMIFTGREIPESIVSLSDICTRMVEVKHYYNEGVLAKKGYDW